MDIKEGATLYELNSDRLFIPASNLKLITSAAALKRLKSDYSFKTTVSTDGALSNGILDGNLYIKGYGDPKLVSEELWLITNDLFNLGIREVKGDIVGDNTFFDKNNIGNGWGEHLSSYAYHAKIDALSLNFNSIAVVIWPKIMNHNGRPNVTVDPDTEYVELVNKTREVVSKKGKLIIDRVPKGKRDRIVVSGYVPAKRKRMTYYRNIEHPKGYILTVFSELLERRGINIQGNVRSGRQPSNAVLLLSHNSKPLVSIIRDLNKMSNNFVAEQILKVMGAEIMGEPGTTDKGIAVIKDFLLNIGISSNLYAIADGSGLSLLNRLTPEAIIKTLIYMINDFESGPEYVTSLAIMGVDGSVADRLKGSLASRKVRAKTGTLDGVICLSGYAKRSTGNIVAFSILMNSKRCSASSMKHIQDNILLSLLK